MATEYVGMEVSELKRVKELEAENSSPKRMYSELSLVCHALKYVIEKKFEHLEKMPT